AEVEGHAVAANERTRRVHHVVQGVRQVGQRGRGAGKTGTANLPVADELDTRVADVEPVGDHAVGDREHVDALAVRQVGTDDHPGPVGKHDLEHRVITHGELGAVVGDAQLDRGEQLRGDVAEQAGVVDRQRRADVVTRATTVEHQVDDARVRGVRPDRHDHAQPVGDELRV